MTTKIIHPSSPRILMYGAGAIGSLFAGKLLGQGYNVSLLARGEWKNQLQSQGLILENCLNQQRQSTQPTIIEKLEAADRYDYIIVAMQATQVDNILPVLAANQSPTIVFVVNQATGYQNWIQAMGSERIMLGFPSAGGERRDGVVHYFVGTGLAKLFQTTTFSELDGKPSPRLKKLLQIFRHAGFAPTSSKAMAHWQACHVAVIVPIAQALYAFDSNNYALSRSPPHIHTMIVAVRSYLKALARRGIPTTPRKLGFFFLPLWLLKPIFALILRTKIAEFAMAKHTIAAKPEIAYLAEQLNLLLRG